jgi:hypothetical protein
VIRVTVAIERSSPNSDKFQVIHTPMLRFLAAEEASMTLMDDGHEIEALMANPRARTECVSWLTNKRYNLPESRASAVSQAIKPDLIGVA